MPGAGILFGALIFFAGLNVVSAVVSVIWLAARGEWNFLIGGGIAFLFGSMIAGLATSVLHVPIEKTGLRLWRKGQTGAAILVAVLSLLAAAAAVTAWSVFVLHYVISKGPFDTLWLVVIFSFHAAFGGWTYVDWEVFDVYDDDELGFSHAWTKVFAQTAYIAMATVILFFFRSGIDGTLLFAAVMVAGVFVQLPAVLFSLRAYKDRPTVTENVNKAERDSGRV